MYLVFPLIAASVLLAWDASPDPDVAGYRLYVGIQSLQEGNPPLLAYPPTTESPTTELQYQVEGLDYGTEYFFCATATNSAGLESGYSNEVQFTPTPTLNIGETAVLSTADQGSRNLLVAQKATLPVTAVLQSMSFYVTNAAGRLRLGVYDASGPGGGPGNKIAETAEIRPVNGWNTGTTPPTVLPAGSYWLAYFPSRNSLAFVKNLDGAEGRYYSLPYGPLPSTFSTNPSSTQSHWSFYATLQP